MMKLRGICGLIRAVSQPVRLASLELWRGLWGRLTCVLGRRTWAPSQRTSTSSELLLQSLDKTEAILPRCIVAQASVVLAPPPFRAASSCYDRSFFEGCYLQLHPSCYSRMKTLS